MLTVAVFMITGAIIIIVYFRYCKKSEKFQAFCARFDPCCNKCKKSCDPCKPLCLKCKEKSSSLYERCKVCDKCKNNCKLDKCKTCCSKGCGKSCKRCRKSCKRCTKSCKKCNPCGACKKLLSSETEMSKELSASSNKKVTKSSANWFEE